MREEPIPHVKTAYEDSLIQLLTPIIKNRQLIKFWYEDTNSYHNDWRIVEPHLIGQHKYKAANIMLVAWFIPTQEQIGYGHSEDWKQYNLSYITKLEILPSRYINCRPFYNPLDKRMQTIFCAT